MKVSTNKAEPGIHKDLNIMLELYSFWSALSASSKFHAMFKLVKPNSDFHGLTYACQKSNETGINYFYEFDELEIVSFSKNDSIATIQGSVVLNMVCAENNYKGKFKSTCCKDESSMDWKLNDIEIEWE